MNQTKNFSGLVSLMLAVLIGALPFAAPEACAQALREGLTLCSGPLLLSLYPFLVVSALLIQCPLGDVLALPFRPVAWLVGVYAPCAARVLLVGFMFGNGMSILYSLAGAALSMTVMTLMLKQTSFSLIGVSVAGGVSHNIGQLIIAMLIVQNASVFVYAPALLVAGVAAGVVIGGLTNEILKRVHL